MSGWKALGIKEGLPVRKIFLSDYIAILTLGATISYYLVKRMSLPKEV